MLLLVFTITGFILAYTYKVTDPSEQQLSADFEQKEKYRQQLIEQQERNKELAQELRTLDASIRDYEQQFAKNENSYEQNVAHAETLRKVVGALPVEGQGLRVTLEDGEYDPTSHNPNEYIVHESHVFQVLNELKIAGAEAIAINGKRLKANSYIYCNGPVIIVDGYESAAPFVIEAIGDKEILDEALRLAGGVLDQLVNDRIVVTTEQNVKLTLAATNVGE